MKKRLLVFSLACFFSIQSKSQYASIWAAYPITYTLSSGFATKNTPGALWFGYHSMVQNISTTWHVNKNFCIMGSGLSSIWPCYKIFESNACTGSLSQVLNGYGVSAVETKGSNGEAYAIAGSYDNACYFCTIDKFGNIISTMSYPFPYTPTLLNGTPTQPIIIESDRKDEYFICGYFESDMYIINVDATGAILWSSFYAMGKKVMPKDLIMSPYHQGELVVVGETEVSPIDKQGFFMLVDGHNGGVLNSKIYGHVNEMEGFGSITIGSYVNPNNSDGFVIGGYAHKLNGVIGLTTWVLKLDPVGNFIWSKIIEPTMGSNVGVIDILERLNTFNNYEYYALLNSSVGLQVLKLADDGRPFPISSPNSLHNEFVYDLPSLIPAKATSLSYVNNQVPGADVGIQAFGTSSNFSGFSNSYAVSAYFNGETNCYRTLGVINNHDKGGRNSRHIPTNKYGSYSTCSNFQIQAFFPGGSINYPCQGLMSTGSNQRTLPAGVNIKADEEENFSVFPNPITDKAQVNYSVSDNSEVNIYIYSLLGEKILHLKPELKLAGNYTEEINFSALDLKNGIYFVTTVVDGTAHKQKIIYTH